MREKPFEVRVQTRRASESEVLPGVSKAKALLFLAAGLSLVASVGLFFSGDHEKGIFVGLWVPSILSGGALLMGRDDDE